MQPSECTSHFSSLAVLVYLSSHLIFFASNTQHYFSAVKMSQSICNLGNYFSADSSGEAPTMFLSSAGNHHLVLHSMYQIEVRKN